MKLATIGLAIAFTVPSTFALARGGMGMGSHVTRLCVPKTLSGLVERRIG